ncbi:unnamed protein product, partial [Cuscuta europaea]
MAGDEVPKQRRGQQTEREKADLVIQRKFGKKQLQNVESMRINCYCSLSEVVKRIKQQLKAEELVEFRRSVFGWVLDVEEMRTISGQLQLGFLCNYVKKVNG